MKRKTAIVVAALAVAVVAVALWTRRDSDWKFVSRITGFDFPAGTEYLAQYDNAEWFVVSVVRLPESSVSAFIREHRFDTGERHSMTTALSLPAKYCDVPARADIMRAEGQKEYQAWQALFDPRSRLLWIHITYPDWGGTHPGTAPQPKRDKA